MFFGGIKCLCQVPWGTFRDLVLSPHPLTKFQLIFDFRSTEGSPFMSWLMASPCCFSKCHRSLISFLIWWIFEGSLRPTTHTHTYTHTYTDTGMLISLLLSLFHSGYREGFLWKRGRDNGQFLSRKFILSEREGALKYFNKQDVSYIISLRLKTFKDTLTTKFPPTLREGPRPKSGDENWDPQCHLPAG